MNDCRVIISKRSCNVFWTTKMNLKEQSIVHGSAGFKNIMKQLKCEFFFSVHSLKKLKKPEYFDNVNRDKYEVVLEAVVISLGNLSHR